MKNKIQILLIFIISSIFIVLIIFFMAQNLSDVTEQEEESSQVLMQQAVGQSKTMALEAVPEPVTIMIKMVWYDDFGFWYEWEYDSAGNLVQKTGDDSNGDQDDFNWYEDKNIVSREII